MQPMKLGAKGADVVKLQEKLKALGFNPGRIDGDFGTGTDAAVLAFQKSEGLLADGEAGVKTLIALGFDVPQEIVLTVSVIPKLTTGIVSRMFPFTPIENIKKNLPFIV